MGKRYPAIALRSFQEIAVLPGDKGHAVANQVNDAGLRRRLRDHRGNRLGKPCLPLARQLRDRGRQPISCQSRSKTSAGPMRRCGAADCNFERGIIGSRAQRHGLGANGALDCNSRSTARARASERERARASERERERERSEIKTRLIPARLDESLR
jgi:hypothetical protein